MNSFVVILLIAILATAAAFQSPLRLNKVSNKAMLANKAPLKMSPTDVVIDSTDVLSKFSSTLASVDDFGGYVGPAGSLLFIGFLILVLSPPLAAKESD